MTGTCRFCGCTDDRACPEGCSWANRGRTVCSSCVRVDRAWRIGDFDRRPNMTRAFARGFMAATNDGRAPDVVRCPKGCAITSFNPYAVGGEAWRYWYRRYDAGGGKTTALGTPRHRPHQEHI